MEKVVIKKLKDYVRARNSNVEISNMAFDDGLDKTAIFNYYASVDGGGVEIGLCYLCGVGVARD